MNPDGFVELYLDVPEQRRIAMHLVRLAVVEPGENWEGTVVVVGIVGLHRLVRDIQMKIITICRAGSYPFHG